VISPFNDKLPEHIHGIQDNAIHFFPINAPFFCGRLTGRPTISLLCTSGRHFSREKLMGFPKILQPASRRACSLLVPAVFAACWPSALTAAISAGKTMYIS